MKTKRLLYFLIAILILGYAALWSFKKFNFNTDFTVGQKIDSLNGVFVHYNGGVDNVTERNTTADGYNLGLKYQCVEFVKRYYFEHYNHKMPDSYGHAKNFFEEKLADGQRNEKRNLTQYTNPSQIQPKVGDLLIFDGNVFNRFGHVAIISNVAPIKIQIIQQNAGPFSQSRESFSVENTDGKWKIDNDRILGWLRKE